MKTTSIPDSPRAWEDEPAILPVPLVPDPALFSDHPSSYGYDFFVHPVKYLRWLLSTGA